MSAIHAQNEHYFESMGQTKTKQVTVVRKTEWITKGEKALYSIVGAALIAASVFIVSFSSSTDTLNRDVQKLETTVQKQQVANEGLMYEKKELSNPKRITKIARKHGLTIENSKVKHVTAFNN